jgi:hypothetical protein
VNGDNLGNIQAGFIAVLENLEKSLFFRHLEKLLKRP